MRLYFFSFVQGCPQVGQKEDEQAASRNPLGTSVGGSVFIGLRVRVLYVRIKEELLKLSSHPLLLRHFGVAGFTDDSESFCWTKQPLNKPIP